jgi:SAM-dependent methyltransferase
MTDETAQAVERHYTQGKLLDRMFAALRAAGVDLDRLRPEDLYPMDQLHGGGLGATKEHARRAGIARDMHVLDLGCGVGGSSRYLAATIGCRVTGIDLTREFTEVAVELTARCGLAGKASFRQANALDLPFEAASFDHVWCHNVTMNIPDKRRFASEVARVLKPARRLSCVEVSRGPSGAAIVFPVPWARVAAHSFLVTPEEMRAALEAGGLRIVEQSREVSAGPAPAPAASATSPLTNAVIMGDDMPERMRNSARSARDGATLSQFILAEKA